MEEIIKLLLVEDDANLCYIIQGGLEDMIGGYKVLTASNGEEGLAVWKAQQPDVIVADIEMPVIAAMRLYIEILPVSRGMYFLGIWASIGISITVSISVFTVSPFASLTAASIILQYKSYPT